MEEKFFLEPDRIAVFLGKNGEQKKKFEEELSCTLAVDSKTGEVTASSEDSVNLFTLSQIIMAVNLGHNPEHAENLEDETIVLDVINIKDKVKNQDRVKTVVGRVIGKNGSTRKTIEEVTGCQVAIKDTIVSAIGRYENIMVVHEALEMLISGMSHKSFYAYLERNKTKEGLL